MQHAAPHERLLVLESTFTSAADVGAEAYPWLPVRWMMRNRFDSMAVADRVRCPTLVIHGEVDRMIHPDHGRALAAAIGPAEFMGVAHMGHNDRVLTDRTVWARFMQLIDTPSTQHP